MSRRVNLSQFFLLGNDTSRRCNLFPTASVLALSLGLSLVASSANAQFPAAGDDTFTSTGMFKITLIPSGATSVITLSGPTCVGRSGPHLQTADPSGVVGDGTLCAGSPAAIISDAGIGAFPPGFNTGLGFDEVHTDMLDMALTGGGFSLSVGASAPLQPRSVGEVEGRSGAPGFPADSFFNLFFDVGVPGATLFNLSPLVVQRSGITAFPPSGEAYTHNFTIRGRVPVFDRATGCLAAIVEQGTHGVSPPGPALPFPPPLTRLRLRFPVVFSVAPGAEGLTQPDPCAPGGHPPPNDIYALGTAGLGNPFPSLGYATEGELFQASGALLGGVPDLTNVDRISSALGIGPAPFGGPPFVGPFSPNPGAPVPAPAPPGGPGTFGLAPTDDIISLSFGCDVGNTLVFSVDDAASGAAGSAVEFHATLSPPSGPLSSVVPPSNGGGDMGDEAAGDLYFSATSNFVPLPFGFFGGFCPGRRLFGVVPAPPGSNILAVDEVFLGLQAPAIAHSGLPPSPPEDDLDALEVEDGTFVDADGDGVVDAGAAVFFTLAVGSPSLPGIPATSNDILVETGAGAPAIYASGVADIGLLAGDVIDALALFDDDQDGLLGPGDMALFSLQAGSPSLVGAAANPNMPPGPGPLSPGDVFLTLFQGPPLGGQKIVAYGNAVNIGLLATDELDALDLGLSFPCFNHEDLRNDPDHPMFDGDGDQVGDFCDNAPGIHNPVDPDLGEQRDYDGDWVGDLADNCPHSYNPDQADGDGNGAGDACESSSPVSGEATGGAVQLDVANVTVFVVTNSGETAVQVAQNIVDAINADSTLAAESISAFRVGAVVVTQAAISNASSSDSGVTFGVPAVPSTSSFGAILIGLLLLVAGAVAIGQSRRRFSH